MNSLDTTLFLLILQIVSLSGRRQNHFSEMQVFNEIYYISYTRIRISLLGELVGLLHWFSPHRKRKVDEDIDGLFLYAAEHHQDLIVR